MGETKLQRLMTVLPLPRSASSMRKNLVAPPGDGSVVSPPNLSVAGGGGGALEEGTGAGVLGGGAFGGCTCANAEVASTRARSVVGIVIPSRERGFVGLQTLCRERRF